MLKKRLLTALWGVPLVIVAVWFDEPIPWFTALAAVAGFVAALEFYHMVGVSRIIPLAVCGLILTLIFIVYPHFNVNLDLSLVSLILTAAVVLPMLLMLFVPKREGIFRHWAWTLTGVLYIGWLISCLVALRLEAGRDWVFLVLFATFGSDTAAYFIGKAIGRHKMAPAISPGKTWEGAVAGVLGAAVIGYLFTLDTPLRLPLDYAHAIILGVVISIFGQLGDLAESMLKRGTGVKDSGIIMPGHGGILDRLDSILFAGVIVYLFYNFFIT